MPGAGWRRPIAEQEAFGGVRAVVPWLAMEFSQRSPKILTEILPVDTMCTLDPKLDTLGDSTLMGCHDQWSPQCQAEKGLGTAQ